MADETTLRAGEPPRSGAVYVDSHCHIGRLELTFGGRE